MKTGFGMRAWCGAALLAGLLAVAGCGDSGNSAGRKADRGASPFVLVALGDSLTAGYGLKEGEGFTFQLESALRDRGYNVRVVNAGVSGDTTAEGLARLDRAVGRDAQAVLVELGANDMLRGVPPEETRRNLEQILSRLEARKLPVLLAGMKAVPGMGGVFGHAIDKVFEDLAGRHDVIFYPFFLEDVVLRSRLNQSDGLHPNAAGVAVIVRNILPDVEDLLEE